jgi:predicted phosphoribosyltransferase
VVVAVPVGSIRSAVAGEAVSNDVICPTPRRFATSMLAYRDFSGVTDDDVRHLLEETAGMPG